AGSGVVPGTVSFAPKGISSRKAGSLPPPDHPHRQRQAMRIPSLLALATLLPFALPAQESQVRLASTGFVLESGEHHLADVLDQAAEFLGRNYLMSRTEMANAVVVLQEKVNLDATGCEEFASQLAFNSGFVVVELDTTKNLFEVIY